MAPDELADDGVLAVRPVVASSTKSTTSATPSAAKRLLCHLGIERVAPLDDPAGVDVAAATQSNSVKRNWIT